MKRNIVCIVMCAVLLLCTGCTGAENKQNDKIKVLTTVFASYDFVRHIGGGSVETKLLLSPGVESHGYELSLSEIAELPEYDYLIYVGGESDEWVDEALEAAGCGDMKRLKMTDCATLLKEEVTEGLEEAADGDYDEHVWTSPKNAIKIVEAIRRDLCEIKQSDADKFDENAKEYTDKLEYLDEKLEAVVKNAPTDTIIFEGRFPFLYLCRDYGIKYFAALKGCSSKTEVSSYTVVKLINLIEENHLKAIFHIELSECTVADAICESTGVKKLLLHSCHNVSESDFDGGETYLSLTEKNIENIAEALGYVAD